MKLSIDTPAYNEKRYGKPYIAKLSFSENPQGEPVWGNWIGAPGNKGILQMDCAEGDVLMRGQKDNRNSRYSAPDYGFVEIGGGVVWGLDKASAYKKWDEIEKGISLHKERQLSKFTDAELLEELTLRGHKVEISRAKYVISCDQIGRKEFSTLQGIIDFVKEYGLITGCDVSDLDQMRRIAVKSSTDDKEISGYIYAEGGALHHE